MGTVTPLDVADILMGWLYNLNGLWGYLHRSFGELVYDFVDIFVGDLGMKAVHKFLSFAGLYNYSIFEFILGNALFLFVTISIVKFIFDLLSLPSKILP